LDGVADPQTDFWTNGIITPLCDLLSGIRGGIAGRGGVEPPPIEFPVYLNQAVRFDHPGKDRLYARSRHRFLGHAGDASLPPLISNMLEFNIVERDPAWEANAFDQAIVIINSSSDAAARTEAAHAIRYMGTTRAIDEMARRLFRSPPRWGGPSDPDSELDSHWLLGLYGTRERAQVVGRVERELDRAERHVSPRFVTIWHCSN
jgi:hypothetical protein